jgi:L-histidine N-alpha-methyltransferase
MSSDFPARFRAAVGSGATLIAAPGTRESRLDFARSVAAGLSDEPKWLHCRFLYDAEGSRLFERITQQPEYYPTRTEAAILARHAAEVREITGPRTLVELGSGYSVKTEHLLNTYVDQDNPLLYVPVDVSDSSLREASKSIAERFSDVRFTGVNGTYRSAFPILRQLSPQMVIFLGSSIGNFNPAETTAFCRNLAGHLPTGDNFLLGIDLVKDIAVLEAAYNDAAGVTTAFTKNYFARMNRELGSDIDIDRIEHVATWNPELCRIEIFAHFHTDQEIYIEPLDERIAIAAGERILVEISRKYRVSEVADELARFGFDTRRVYTDQKEWFALLLLERSDDSVLRRSPFAAMTR